jgi:CheY-like chemotaxis protein
MQKAFVLVVDDVRLYFDIFKSLMKPRGITVHCVTDGQQAVDAIRKEKTIYSAIFIDKLMPGMDGTETAQQIRRIGTRYAATVPLIAFSSDTVYEDKRMFLCKGFQDILSKPVVPAELGVIIRRWILPEAASAEAPAAKAREADKIFNKHINGLSMKRCAEHFCADGELFGEFLSTFAADIPQQIEKARKALSENKLGDYTIYIHALKGSCRNICADEAGDRAEALERAAKAGDCAFVHEHNGECLEAVSELIMNIKNALNNRNL